MVEVGVGLDDFCSNKKQKWSVEKVEHSWQNKDTRKE